MVFFILCQEIWSHCSYKSYPYITLYIFCHLYPTSLANLVVEVGTRQSPDLIHPKSVEKPKSLPTAFLLVEELIWNCCKHDNGVAVLKAKFQKDLSTTINVMGNGDFKIFQINSLSPGKYESNLQLGNFKSISRIWNYENHHVMTCIGSRVNATFIPDNFDHVLIAVLIMILPPIFVRMIWI